MEPIKWHALTPAQRDETIHEKVFGHERKTATHTSKTRAGDSFSYNVTSWQTGGPDTPRYSQSLDAAWLVVERVMRPAQSREEALRASATRFMLWFEHVKLWACTQQDAANEICTAALRAMGYEVLTEEVFTEEK